MYDQQKKSKNIGIQAEKKSPLAKVDNSANYAEKDSNETDLTQLQSVADNYLDDKHPIHKKNNTGLPDQLKSGIENLSGYSMDDVKVHYNSNKPAQLQAHAYAQGNQIHLAPGQEKHLPHEAWHVVQQKQGRVKPTKQLKAKVNINDEEGLEKEADVMGAKAAHYSQEVKSVKTEEKARDQSIENVNQFVKKSIESKNTDSGIVQRIEIGDQNKSILELTQEIKDNPDTPWYDEYSDILLELELNNDSFANMIDLIMTLGSMKLGGAYRHVDESGYDAGIEDNDDYDSEYSEDIDSDSDDYKEKERDEKILKEYNLDSIYLYRAKNLKGKVATKQNTVLRGFFTTSLDYALLYYKDGPKGKYESMIRITLSKPIGNILIDLIKSKDAFKQNAGSVGKLLDNESGIQASQKRVQQARIQQGILVKKELLTNDYRDDDGRSRKVRKNTPNAVMIKQEPLGDQAVTNIEITSRIMSYVKGKTVLIESPLDKYVTSVEEIYP